MEMAQEKENFKMTTKKSKIPLPMEPLPLMPQVNDCQKDIAVKRDRPPLRILNSAGPSTNLDKRLLVTSAEPSYTVIDKGISRRLTKYVTTRKQDSPLDWELKVFKDKKEKKADKNVSISCEKDKFGVKECDLLCLGDGHKAKTPYSGGSRLEPARIRNIKRSLKRPHSRELQGISPINEGNKIRGDRSKVNFTDSIIERLQSPDILTQRYTNLISEHYSHEIFEYLMSIERKPLGIPRLPSITRACVVNWLIKVNGEDGDPSTTQVACWYLDSLTAIREIKIEHLQVMAAGCYWIAQKLHGPYGSASKLVKNGGNSYSTVQLCRAEQKILRVLKFPCQPVVAQDFITYLAWWCDSKNPGIIEVAASFLCLCGLLVDKMLACEYPSILASAGVYNAILLLENTELIPRLLLNSVFTEAKKKSCNFSYICSSLRRAVELVGLPCSEYRAPFEYYCKPPHMIAQKIIDSINHPLLSDDSNNSIF